MGGPTGGLLLPLACPPSTHTPIIQYQYTCSANIASDGPGLGPALLSRTLQTNTQIKKCCPQNANVAWESLWYFLLSSIYKPFSTLVLEVPIQWPQLLCCTQLLYRKKKVSFTNTHSSKEAAEAVEREIISLRIGGRQWVALSAQLWTISSAAPGSVLSRILRLPWRGEDGDSVTNLTQRVTCRFLEVMVDGDAIHQGYRRGSGQKERWWIQFCYVEFERPSVTWVHLAVGYIGLLLWRKGLGWRNGCRSHSICVALTGREEGIVGAENREAGQSHQEHQHEGERRGRNSLPGFSLSHWQDPHSTDSRPQFLHL